jgi:DNA-binding transcriptional LysR family regulator
VPAAALADEAFIAREIGSGTGAVVDRALWRAGMRLRPSVRVADSHGVAETVAAGGGIGIVSALVAEPLVAARRVVRVAIEGVSLVRPFSVVQLPGRSVGTLDAELLRLVGG